MNQRRRRVVRRERMDATQQTAMTAGATLAAALVTRASIVAERWDGIVRFRQCDHDCHFGRSGKRSRQVTALQMYKECSSRRLCSS
jgi:hypothetical protein